MLKSTYTPPPPLPPGWTEHKAPTGHIFYYNADSKQSTYQRPSLSPLGPYPTVVPSSPAIFPFTGFPQRQEAFAGTPFNVSDSFRQHRRHDEHRRRHPEDRPKSKHAIPGCDPWLLVKTKLGRRFVHNPETTESYWKYPEHILKGVIEYDRIEREKMERIKRDEESEAEGVPSRETSEAAATEERSTAVPSDQPQAQRAEAEDDEYEYEEVEMTDDEDKTFPSKRQRADDGNGNGIEFTEDDIAYQLAAMGEDYGLDPGEFGEPGEEDWEEGEEGLPLTEEDSTVLFTDLLNDFRINPYTPWEIVIEEGKIIDDPRYTALPNMKSRREAWSNWSRERIQEIKEQKATKETKDPRIQYLEFLQEHATPKLYWPEFKRKFRKETEMKDARMTDKEREKYYRDHITRLKLPESTRKSDLSALLKLTPLRLLNRSSTLELLPPSILTDLRYISLPAGIRDQLIEAHILTLSPAPEQFDEAGVSQDEPMQRKSERERREMALAERERQVQQLRRKQQGALLRGKDLLRSERVEVERAMEIGKEGLKSQLETKEIRPENRNG